MEFAETDAAGIVHFSVFFRYMEEAEHAAWRAAGLDIATPGEGLSWPRISAHCDFTSALRFQDEFEIHTTIAATTRSTIKWEHAIVRGATVIGNGSVTAVCVRLLPDGSMKSTAIPSEIVAKLQNGV